MIVGQQDHVDPGKIFESDPGWPHPLRAGECHRADAFAPDRVCQNIQPLRLDEEGGMVDKSDHDGIALYSLRRCLAVIVFQDLLPFAPLPVLRPFDDIFHPPPAFLPPGLKNFFPS